MVDVEALGGAHVVTGGGGMMRFATISREKVVRLKSFYLAVTRE
jgi:hypothetical protein